jgi:hypothetical protein
MVDERRIELGVRPALGASPLALVTLAVRDGLIRVGAGALAGLAVVFVAVPSGFPGLLGVSAADLRFWVAIVARTGPESEYDRGVVLVSFRTGRGRDLRA